MFVLNLTKKLLQKNKPIAYTFTLHLTIESVQKIITGPLQVIPTPKDLTSQKS